MLQVEMPFAKPISAAQIRSIDYLVARHGWPRARAIRYYEIHNQKVAERRTKRQLTQKVKS